jgi:proteic killer suppression protein
MIRSFRSKETEKVFRREFSRRLPEDIHRVALRKLRMLDAAVSLNDLRTPPSNRLEALRDDRKGQHSIRINDATNMDVLVPRLQGCRRVATECVSCGGTATRMTSRSWTTIEVRLWPQRN